MFIAALCIIEKKKEITREKCPSNPHAPQQQNEYILIQLYNSLMCLF